jgi:hypothetical protein
MIKYVVGAPQTNPPDGLYSVLEANWDKRFTTVSNRVKQISVQVDASGCNQIVDSQSGDKFPSQGCLNQDHADFGMQGRIGSDSKRRRGQPDASRLG